MIWDFQDALTRRLLLWSALSIAGGALLLTSDSPLWRGFAVQALVWGLVDAAIALGGRFAGERRRTAHRSEPGFAASVTRNLGRLLWINTGLDVLYVAGGAVLVSTLGRTDPFAAGNGWGIVVQGGFLFVFDLLHALAVPTKESALPPFDAFRGPEHKALRLTGDRGSALLVHGFGGSPAELRSLAEALNRDGWTAEVMLLPGFGDEIGTLPDRRYDEWIEAVQSKAEALQEAGQPPLILVGYSMGAALSIVVECDVRPAGTVLLAPFWWAEPLWLRVAEFFIRPFLPAGFRPLRKADLNSDQFRAGINKFMPGLDLDDPQVQAAVRDFRVPLSLIDQLRGLSRRVLKAAPGLQSPVLVVQGSCDTVARPELTRRLVKKLPGGTRYVEVDSEHDLTLADKPGYQEVERIVTSFAGSIRNGAR